MTLTDWNNITNYMDSVGTTLKTFTFNKTQNFVKVTTRGNASVNYTIGSQSGTLTSGQSVSVSENISSFTLTAASGTQTIEVWATEAGTEKEETGFDVVSQLAEKAKKTEIESNVKNSNLYTNAVNELSNIVFDFPNLITRMRKQQKSIKIAFVGDSITEGYNNYIESTYAKVFERKVSDMLSVDVQVNVMNFALGGRATSHLIRNDFVCASVETDGNNNFSRTWGTVGKSWKQHIYDYQPDLLIIAFGMNDVGINKYADRDFMANMSQFMTEAKTNMSCDYTFVSTILPTDDKQIHNQNTDYTQQVADVVRSYSKYNGHGLVDANRFWNIIKYGKDVCKYNVEECKDVFTSIENKDFKNFEVNLTFTTFNPDSNPFEMMIREQNGSQGLLLRFQQNASDSAKLIIYDLENLGYGALAVFTNAFVGTNKLTVEDGKFTFNGVTQFIATKVRHGIARVSANNGTCNGFEMMLFHEVVEYPTYSELDLLGAVNWTTSIGTSGNGINHPTALGHYLSYVQALTPILSTLKLARNASNMMVNKTFVISTGASYSPDVAPYVSTSTEGKAIRYLTIFHRQNKLNQMTLADYTKGNYYTRQYYDISQIASLKEGEFCYIYGYQVDDKDNVMFVPHNYVDTDAIVFSMSVNYDD